MVRAKKFAGMTHGAIFAASWARKNDRKCGPREFAEAAHLGSREADQHSAGQAPAAGGCDNTPFRETTKGSALLGQIKERTSPKAHFRDYRIIRFLQRPNGTSMAEFSTTGNPKSNGPSVYYENQRFGYRGWPLGYLPD